MSGVGAMLRSMPLAVIGEQEAYRRRRYAIKLLEGDIILRAANKPACSKIHVLRKCN